MTIATFVDELANAYLARAAVVDVYGDGQIRIYWWPATLDDDTADQSKCLCPLTFLYWHKTGTFLPVDAFDDAGRRLGLTQPEIELIVDAADHRAAWDSKDARQLRSYILVALGLEAQP